MDAGPPHLDQVVPDRGEAPKVELALGVEASRAPGSLGRQQPVGGDDLVGGRLTHQQVIAVGVEGVAVQAGFGAVEPGAEFTGEDQVPQPLGGAYVVLAGGEGDPVPRGGGLAGRGDAGGRGGGRGEGQHGHDGLRVRIGSGCRAAAGVRQPGPLLLP